MFRFSVLVLAGATLATAPFAVAQKDARPPPPDTYLCPSTTAAKAVDCFLNAVEHLYTMCWQVKSLEIIEFGYEKAQEGVNGAKSEYCINKHKASMSRLYKAALREATRSRSAVDGLRALYDYWLKALADLKWTPGESDAAYKERTAKPYAVFSEQATVVRVALEHASTPATSAKSTPATVRKSTN